MPVPLLWLILAIGLAGAEALTGDMFLLMLSGGALATAGLSWATDWPIWADGASFLIVSVLLLVLVRPTLRKRLGAAGLPEPVKALEGKTALVLERVARHEGQVKLDGEIWTARPMDDDDVFEPGDHVTVMKIDGATAVVYRTI
ncbi:membrane protein [Mycobacterium sp. ST-F2]|uniref:NfeD family protein n=1 Tax=Mycobacterium sp. ST-F2 TaxID=1490484 RepID=UPI00093B3B22|nr:NfeD family protein [Mycobacterium sp. ST-F2]OKH81726.1 membrane protein [Mycobacterium sp. ST-F2]